MTATKVYGITIGDQFKDPEGNLWQVNEFITPDNPSRPWQLRAHGVEDISTEIMVPVKEVKEWLRQ